MRRSADWMGMRVLAWAIAALAGVMAFSPLAAQARDRPGTPVDQYLWACAGTVYGPKSLTEGPPAICINFTNTANEKVSFEVVITANGQRLSDDWLAHNVEPYTDPVGRQMSQVSQTVSNYIENPKHEGGYIERRNSTNQFAREGFMIVNLAFNTTYCVHIKAREMDGVVSGQYSDSPCLTTRANIAKGNCTLGYVWRGAFDGDAVCVTPQMRDQAGADNAAAASRIANPGSNICKVGFVWRAAGPHDAVCVTPQMRDQVSADNLAGPSRIVR